MTKAKQTVSFLRSAIHPAFIARSHAPDSSLLSAFLALTAAITGACVGSFLNVVIYRLPREDCQIHKPSRSFCPHCKKPIPWYLNIPVLAWLYLSGKCQNCKEPISWRYPAIEALTAAFFVWIWFAFGSVDTWPTALAYWVLISLFIAATFIDLEHMIIPNMLTIGALPPASWPPPSCQP